MPLPDPSTVTPWLQRKINRGRREMVDRQGLAEPNPKYDYWGITDPAIHALAGYGWIDLAYNPQTPLPGLPQNLHPPARYPTLLSQNVTTQPYPG